MPVWMDRWKQFPYLTKAKRADQIWHDCLLDKHNENYVGVLLTEADLAAAAKEA